MKSNGPLSWIINLMATYSRPKDDRGSLSRIMGRSAINFGGGYLLFVLESSLVENIDDNADADAG